MNPTRSFVAVTCMAIVSACSTVMAPLHSDFLSSYSALSRDRDGSARKRSTEVIDPTRVTIGAIEWRVPGDTDVGRDERDLLLRQLSDELTARVRDLPAAPDGRPAVLRAAITRVETVSPALNAASALLLVVPLDRGGASVDVEAIDPETGDQLAALTQGHFAPLSEIKAHFSKLAPAQLALRKAAADFGVLMRPSDDARDDR
jgi:hypothetical protein